MIMSTRPIQRIDVLMTDISQYSVLHHFSKKLHEALMRAGYQSRLLTRQNRRDILLQDPPQLTIAFNGLPAMEGEAILCDLIKIPHLAILVDPPYWGGVFIIKSPYMMLGCDDEYGCTFLEHLNFQRSLFIPHAVEPELVPDPKLEKIYEVTLLATFIDYEAEMDSWKDKFPPQLVGILQEAAQETFEDPSISFIQSFMSNFYTNARKYDLAHLPSNLFFEALQGLEKYIKGKDRALLIKSLEGFPVHIFGHTTDKTNWKTYLGNKYPHVHVHEAVDFEQALEIMKRSKIVLNPSLKNKQGSHERFFSGTSCGALVISSESEYLKTHFTPQQEVLMYQHTHLKDLNAVIQGLLQDEANRNTITEKARAKVQQHHTWDARIRDFMPKIEAWMLQMPIHNT